jgi:hypothetical protein
VNVKLIYRAFEKDQKMGSHMELHKMCLGSFHLFLKKDGWGLRADNEKRNAAALLYCVHFRTLADSICLPGSALK